MKDIEYLIECGTATWVHLTYVCLHQILCFKLFENKHFQSIDQDIIVKLAHAAGGNSKQNLENNVLHYEYILMRQKFVSHMYYIHETRVSARTPSLHVISCLYWKWFHVPKYHISLKLPDQKNASHPMFKPHNIGKYDEIQHFFYSLIKNFALWPKVFGSFVPKLSGSENRKALHCPNKSGSHVGFSHLVKGSSCMSRDPCIAKVVRPPWLGAPSLGTPSGGWIWLAFD